MAVRGKSNIPDDTEIKLEVEAMSRYGEDDFPDTKKEISLTVISK